MGIESAPCFPSDIIGPVKCQRSPIQRPAELSTLYDHLAKLLDNSDGPHYLRNYEPDAYPDAGIYFFFSPGTDLSAPPSTWRLTRIGTIGVSEGSSATLANRLRQHRGTGSSSKYGENGGNHRGSIYRQHVGAAFLAFHDVVEDYPHWGEQTRDLDDVEAVRQHEHSIEQQVSGYLRNLPFLVVDVPGPSHSTNDRSYIERNTIALVSQQRRQHDITLSGWLGEHSPRHEIRRTGLWNLQHVNEWPQYTALDTLDDYIESM
jgi:hypothetical protein